MDTNPDIDTPSGFPRRAGLRALIFALIWFLAVPAAAEDYEYIDITNPNLRKIPVAIPVFKAMSGTEEEHRLARQGADTLAAALDFTGFFKLLDRGAFLINPRDPAIMAPHIKFANWTGIGAELLGTGGLLQSGRTIEIELRLYDTFKGRLLVGKRYKGWATDLRRMVHRFCSEVIFQLTGNRGIFGSKVAFVSTGSGYKQIYSCEFDGYAPRQLTHHKDITLFPSWSSDSEWLAYTTYAKGKPDLYIKHLRDKRGAIVAKNGINSTPAWRPGRFELAATLSFTGDPEIYLLTGTGKIIKRLTKSKGIDSSPSWSPDGERLAFVSRRSGSPQIYIMTVASGEVQRLTYEGRYNTQPSWSPRGDRIAYTVMEKGKINIRTIGLDGMGMAQLTHDTGDNESATWSPDGSLIAFSSTREGPSRIYVMTAYGTDQRRLLTLPGQQSGPEWSPGGLN